MWSKLLLYSNSLSVKIKLLWQPEESNVTVKSTGLALYPFKQNWRCQVSLSMLVMTGQGRIKSTQMAESKASLLEALQDEEVVNNFRLIYEPIFKSLLNLPETEWELEVNVTVHSHIAERRTGKGRQDSWPGEWDIRAQDHYWQSCYGSERKRPSALRGCRWNQGPVSI